MDYNPSPYSLERSLLQKAVRRGDQNVVEKVIKYLLSEKDKTWLRKRLYIITYEECWMYGDNFIDGQSEYKITEHYKNLAVSVKNKNAAGLASLANSYNKGNRSVLSSADSIQSKAITTIANAIKSPKKYWTWIKDQPGYKKNKSRIDKAEKAISKLVYDEEKAMTYATAYFCIKDNIPDVVEIPPNNSLFPYWVAIDKHTPDGRDIITTVAQKYKIRPDRLMWIAFFMEGSLCNKMTESPYWELAKLWKMKNMRLTIEEAEVIWENVKSDVIAESKICVDNMLDRINNVKEEESGQLSMF